MREHEIELIAALVEGNLEDETEARALVATSDEARKEYESQRLAFEALSTAGMATLSQSEEAALQRDVWTALRSAPALAPRSTPWYYRWVSVAAGLFVVVGLFTVLSQGDDADSNTPFEEATASLAATTTAAAATEAGGGSAAPAADGGAEEAAVEEADEGTADVPAEPQVASFFAAEAEKVREGELAGIQLQSRQEAPTEDDLMDCLQQAGFDRFVAVSAIDPLAADVTGTTSEAPPAITPFIAAIPEDADLATAIVVFVDLLSCELIHLDE